MPSDSGRLTLLIPTLPRLDSAGRPLPYLRKTLDSVADAMREGEGEGVTVVVLDFTPPGRRHAVLDELVERPPTPFQLRRPDKPAPSREAILARCERNRLERDGEEHVLWAFRQARNFIELLRVAQHADAALAVRLEDDARVSKDFFREVFRIANAHPRAPFLSLFSLRLFPDHSAVPYLAGAVALLFFSDDRLYPIIEYVEKYAGLEPFDVLLGNYRDAAGRGGLEIFPSIVQHFGRTRSLRGSKPGRVLESPTFRRRAGGVRDALRRKRVEALYRLLRLKHQWKPPANPS